MSLDWLLVEGRARAAASIESVTANGLEVPIFGGLYPHKPAQRTEAPFEHSLLPGGVPAQEQGVRQLGIVVTQLLFKPGPVRVRGPVEDVHQPVGESIAGLMGQAVAAQTAQIFVDANEAECPCAR